MFTKTLSDSLLCALLAFSVSGVFAAESAQVPEKKSISEFVSPDGRIDLDAIKRSNYQGPLDLKGVDVRIDPKTSEPLVQVAPVMALSAVPDDIYWDTTISPSVAGGLNNGVRALTVYNNKLIAGGFFTYAGGVAVNRIAAWDGSSWSALGTGMSGQYPEVLALTVYDNKLIAAGKFNFAGGVAVYRIASWDGVSWSALGTGIGGATTLAYVYALTVYDNKLIAGGYFQSAGEVAASNIASWDGLSWSALKTGINGDIYALTVYDNKLIAGGSFSAADGVAANNIASWDGLFWSSLVWGVDNTVKALTVQGIELKVGGYFTIAGGLPGPVANRIATWYNQGWYALGAGISTNQLFSVLALTVYDNKLIVGGHFQSGGGVDANFIACWDGMIDVIGGGYWSALGSGTNWDVHALTVFNNNLIVGGDFTNAGWKQARFLARWTKLTATGVGDENISLLPENCVLEQNYPNPFNPSTTIRYSIPTRAHVTIEIFNALGQKLKTLVNKSSSAGEFQVEWDGTNDSGILQASGVYFYRLQAGDAVSAKKMLLLK